jgi:hypothetical protein
MELSWDDLLGADGSKAEDPSEASPSVQEEGSDAAIE